MSEAPGNPEDLPAPGLDGLTVPAPDGPGVDGPGVDSPGGQGADPRRDLAEVPAVEVITTVAVHLMSAAALACGLGEGPEAEREKDLSEARILISALAGLVTAAAPHVGSMHAAPLRDGLRTLQLAFREASAFPDPVGAGPGEDLTGPVHA